MTITIHRPFQFTTKAGNLAQLHDWLTSARTVEQEVVRVGEWRSDRRKAISKLQNRFANKHVIVRSSAPGEDSVESSMAGAFESILNVEVADEVALMEAIEAVAESYVARRTGSIDEYEVLVQPMVLGVKASGVVFTRDLDKGGPYFLLNYDDETDRTDSITGGYASSHKVVRIFKGVNASRIDPILRMVVTTARELEVITRTNALDIEFAIDEQDVIYVLQVRPLARRKIFSYQRLDALIADEIHHAGAFVRQKCVRLPHLFGRTTIFGEMPDWNPAEIIGTRPKPLASSLYTYIIMKSVWRQARQLTGYVHPFPHQLLVNIAGRPYVDVRCSFNSFLPATLSPDLCEKLVNYYLDRLQAHPELHDKIEFEIVMSSLDFDFAKHAEQLMKAGFAASEIEEIGGALLELTNTIVMDRNGLLKRLESDVGQLQHRRDAILASHERASDIPMLVEQLLEDCIQYGTLPFSVFARCAFIGNAFLKSLVDRDVLTQEELEQYLHSIHTVAGDFVEDLGLCKRGSMQLKAFLHRYGHLRPGTYDILAHTYAESPEVYLGMLCGTGCSPTSDLEQNPRNGRAAFPSGVVGSVNKLIEENGFTFNVETLNNFINSSVQLREAVKFEFTKNLSTALSLLIEFGLYHGFTREMLSFLPIEKFMALANQSCSKDWVDDARNAADRNRKRYDLTGAINLPDLIFCTDDIEVIKLQRRRPNFVTLKRLVARGLRLGANTGLDGMSDLSGGIVLIENADPGFDWLFGKNIGGLVTKYGGAASHMTIRCSELGLPAAIGCGEQIFQELAESDSILLDCAERRVEPNRY